MIFFFFRRIKQKYSFKGRQWPDKEMVDSIINDIKCLLSLFFHRMKNTSGLDSVAFLRSDNRGCPSVGQKPVYTMNVPGRALTEPQVIC